MVMWWEVDRWAGAMLALAVGAAKVVAESPWWQAVLVALVSGGGLVAVLGFVRWYITYRNETDNGIEEVLRDQAEIHDQLNKAVSASGARRGLVMRMTNGGGVPRRGACLFVTASFEAVGGAGVPVIQDSWQKRRVGAEYAAALLPMLETGQAQVRASSLPKGSDLRVSFEAAGIGLSRIFEVGQIGKEYFFISFGYETEGDLSPTGVEAVLSAVSIIRRLLKKGPTK